MSKIRVFSGTANKALAREIADNMDISLTKADIKNFSDGETFVELKKSVCGKDVFIIQPTCIPVNDNIMELLIMIDACRRASAGRITAVMPYYGYARQDRKNAPRTPITSKLIANMLVEAGVDRLLTMDLHAGQIQGFFDIPVDHLYATPVMLAHIKKRFKKNFVMVSPDAGGAERTRAYAKRLGVGFALIDKMREKANKAEAMNVVGNVKNKKAILLDDMVDTAGTLCEGAKILKKEGATEVYACCTHAVLSGPAISRIKKSKIKKLTVTNSIPLNKKAKNCKKIEVISVAEMMARAIRRIAQERSVSKLFI